VLLRRPGATMANPKYTDDQIEAALRASAGILSAAAVKLGCTPRTVRNYLDRSEQLRDVEAEILDQNLDLAETKLLTAIRDGNLTAVIFYLKTKGKARGYTERAEVTGADGGPIDVTKLSDEELERIARGELGPHAGAGRAGAAPAGASPR
jgi:Bacterial regulatory protein, Fis family